MNNFSKERLQSAVVELASRARVASRALAKLSNQSRNELLMAVAKAIEDGSRKILQANELDCHAAEPAVLAGTMSSAMLSRLPINPRGVDEIPPPVRAVARLPGPLRRRPAATARACGLRASQEACPPWVLWPVFVCP